MDVHASPAIIVSGPEQTWVLTGTDCVALGRHLADAVKYGFANRGAVVPQVLLDFSITVNRAARASAGSASLRTSATVAASAGPGNDGPVPLWAQPVATLTVAEAAQAAGLSDRWMREMIRRGSVEALRGRRGAWLVRSASLAVWMEARSRKETERRAA